MEAYLLYFACACFGVSLITIAVVFLTKPYRQRKTLKSSNEEAANKIGLIRARLVIHRLKLSGLERQTKWLNEKEEKHKAQSNASS